MLTTLVTSLSNIATAYLHANNAALPSTGHHVRINHPRSSTASEAYAQSHIACAR